MARDAQRHRNRTHHPALQSPYLLDPTTIRSAFVSVFVVRDLEKYERLSSTNNHDGGPLDGVIFQRDQSIVSVLEGESRYRRSQ